MQLGALLFREISATAPSSSMTGGGPNSGTSNNPVMAYPSDMLSLYKMGIPLVTAGTRDCRIKPDIGSE